MKIRTLFAFLVVILAILLVALYSPKQPNNSQYLRIHIRANSNGIDDQNIKYAVKNAITDYLTPKLCSIESKQEALKIINQNIANIVDVCNQVLHNYGFDYQSNAKIMPETFPTRSYFGLTLNSGVYDALIVNLGSGSGDNWWCVVYPPLCFVGVEDTESNQIHYRSKILEIIEEFKKNNSIN